MSNVIAEIFFDIDPNDKLFNLIVEQLDRGGMGSAVHKVIKSLNDALEKFREEAALDGVAPGFRTDERLMGNLSYFIRNELGLRKLGSGTQRYTFQIDNDHVLKLAHNDGGIKANEGEGLVTRSSPLSRYTPKVYYSGPNNYYIISERVTPISGDDDYLDWIEGTDVPDFMKSSVQEFDRIISILSRIDSQNQYSGSGDYDPFDILVSSLRMPYETKEQAENRIKTLFESDFINQLLRIIKDHGARFDRIIRDIVDFNLGFNSEGQSVILDYA